MADPTERMLTDHQVGFFREVAREVLKEVLAEALAGEVADRIAESVAANQTVFAAIGAADDYEAARDAVRKGTGKTVRKG